MRCGLQRQNFENRKMNFESEHFEKYYATRLSGQNLSRQSTVNCPLHEDRTASLSVNLEKGVWTCHAGCGQGGMIEFEMKFSSCDAQTAKENVLKICGISEKSRPPEAVYPYVDEDQNLLYEKLRFPGKKFSQRAKVNGKWVYNLQGVRKVLYHLPELISATDVFVVEGEKDADTLNKVDWLEYDAGSRVTATTNFDGAGKWRGEYNPYFAGKRVVILPDNDAPGKAHAQIVAQAIQPYARTVRVVELPGLREHGDVSDFLAANTVENLLKIIRQTPRWEPKKPQLLVPVSEFLLHASPAIEWIVEGLIQRGSNGFIGALKDGGKSWLAADLALALAFGQPWMGFQVPGRVRVALVTREDNPQLTKWRVKKLAEGRSLDVFSGESEWLYVNSREQSAEFYLDVAEFLDPMISELKLFKPEFLLLDVLNVMHTADENDNTEMRKVVSQISKIQSQVGCQVGVTHHFTKDAQGDLGQKLRGAGAIGGWAEWIIGIEKWKGSDTRKAEFYLKAAQRPAPFFYEVKSDEMFGPGVKIERVDAPSEKKSEKRVEQYM
jgi:hypothetical protein